MAPSKNNLVWVGCPLNFKYQIVGVAVGYELVLHMEVENDGLSSVLHSLEHVGVLG